MHLAHPPRFDPSNNWRFRYHGMFLALAVIVVAADIAFAIFVFFYPFDLYGTVMVVSLIEALVIGGSVALIELHVGTRSHLDLGKALMPLCSLPQIVAVSQLSGLCLTIMSILLHILLLTDPDPDLHGFHPKRSVRRHRHRHQKHRRQRDEEDGDLSGDTLMGDDDDAAGAPDNESDDEGDYKKKRRR
ncbi:hypothetical protein JCM11251_005475 [Rhodosporidiobolus azoricus]